MHISEATRKKAEAAKSYIENMYKMQHQNIQDRLERCDQVSGLWPVLTVCGMRQEGPARPVQYGAFHLPLCTTNRACYNICTITIYCSVA